MFLAAIISISTYIKYSLINNTEKLEVIRKEVISATKDCVLEGRCTGSYTTLGYLIENNYLDEITSPVTGQTYSHDAVIVIAGNTYSFNIVN